MRFERKKKQVELFWPLFFARRGGVKFVIIELGYWIIRNLFIERRS